MKHLFMDFLEAQEYVAPRAGAWIETLTLCTRNILNMSRPVRARGLKPVYLESNLDFNTVAPRAGAWIETSAASSVASFAAKSRPVRARGLKQVISYGYVSDVKVAPRAGAWIETMDCAAVSYGYRRAPCGRVD
ncbi:TPA: hypothetical protein I8Z83_001477 [Legionella pneumophila]|nr:hypothetical protein [Legionella pneumophila]